MPTPLPHVPTPTDWHTLASAEVARRLSTDPRRGLSPAQVDVRIARHGLNRLPHRPPTPWWRILLRQVASPVIYILIMAGVLSVAIGHASDAGFIAIVIALNTAIGGTQEIRAERSAQSLQKLLRFTAIVLRSGEAVEIDAHHVVPGDILWLESGARVPADARLVTATALRADESLLTGESVPVEKNPAWIGESGTPLADRRNMLFAGSTILQGRAAAIVVATGTQSSIGRLARDVLSGPAGRTPLTIRLERFGRAIGLWVVVAAAAVSLTGVLIQHRAWAEMALFGVALCVAAIPEGLPVAITVALAVASRRMARRGVIVRRLGAVEGLGSCTLIATDKTGTLTCNQLTVREIRLLDGAAFRVTGEGFEPAGRVEPVDEDRSQLFTERRDDLAAVAVAAALCNEGDLHERDGGWTWRGDPTDIALLAMAHKLGVTRPIVLDQLPEVRSIPFEPELRYAATFHDAGGGVCQVFAKGAPERVLPMCRLGLDLGRAHAIAADMAARGLRVLAIAEGRVPAPSIGQEPSDLELRGFVGMIDPLRSGVREAVARCRAAGIAVAMVTGDHPVTALAIARDLGIAVDAAQVTTGADLPRELSEIARTIGRTRVFARVTPEQKLAIVRAANAAGHFVAVTGDGVNDAPALRAANIGAAMGKGGTDVARDAADLVISDDNFATIVAGVEEGRIAYANIRKVVYLLVSTGATEVLVAAMGVASGLPLPLLPVQLLWLNLVTNGIQDVALAFEPAEGGELSRPPRPVGERLLNRSMLTRTALSASVMSAVGFGAFAWMLENGWAEDQARNALLLLMVLFENFHVGNCRSETRSIFSLNPFRTPVLLTGTVAAFLLHVAAMHTPGLSGVLGAGPVTPAVWGVLVGLALSVVVAEEVYKAIRRRRAARPARPTSE